MLMSRDYPFLIATSVFSNVYLIKYVIHFVSYLWQVGNFLWLLCRQRHDVTKIWMKVTFSTNNPNQLQFYQISLNIVYLSNSEINPFRQPELQIWTDIPFIDI